MPGRIRFTPRPPRAAPTRVLGRARHPLADLYHYVLTRSWASLLAHLCAAFLALNAAFAWLYTRQPDAIAAARPGSFEDAFFFSVQTMATIGYGDMHPQTRYAHLLVTIEAMLGVLGTALVMGVTFARFARPTARVLFGERAVIGPRDGVPHLMIRMANWRQNLVLEARVRVLLLCPETTGEPVRRLRELPLLEERTPLFADTWTVLHRIDERSPLHGPDALAHLRAAGAELLVLLQGVDDTFNVEIHARHRYTLADIVAGARFGDVLTVRPDGTRELDYRHFHRVVPLDADPPLPARPPPAARAPRL